MSEGVERFEIGATLRGKWRLDRLLGKGGMATVYAATHRNGMRGAVKVLHSDLTRDPEAKNRFLREGYVANAIDHPGVVKVLDDDATEDGDVFLVMELLEGLPLDAVAESSGGRLPAGRVARIGIQVLEVLVAAHKAGVIHRDIKPENIFVTKGGVVKLLDFGIARLKMGDTRLTQTTSTMGTPAFMPPEQALAYWDKVDARSDLFALGASLFNILTGAIVHPGQTPNEVLVNAATKPARPVRSVDAEIPPALAEVVDKALAFDMNDRWVSADSMLAALNKAEFDLQRGQTVQIDPGNNPFRAELGSSHAISFSGAGYTTPLGQGARAAAIAAFEASQAFEASTGSGQVFDATGMQKPAGVKTVVTMVSSPSLASPRGRSTNLIWAGVVTGMLLGVGVVAVAFFRNPGDVSPIAGGTGAPIETTSLTPPVTADPVSTSTSAPNVQPTDVPSVQVSAAPSVEASAKPVVGKPPRKRTPPPQPSSGIFKPKWDGK